MENEDNKIKDVINKIEVCPICKTIVNGEKYCHNCGHKLSNNEKLYDKNKEKEYVESKKNIDIAVIIAILLIIGIIIGIFLIIQSPNKKDDFKVEKYEDIGNNMIFFKCPNCGEGNYISMDKLIGPTNIYDKNELTYEYYCLECKDGLIFRPNSKSVATREVDEILHHLDKQNDDSNKVISNNTSNNNAKSEQYTPWEKPRESGVTGIEQAIKDGVLKDVITNGTSEEWLHFAYTDGGWLQHYYDNWEDCLQDAKDLGILREPTQEELDTLNSGI